MEYKLMPFKGWNMIYLYDNLDCVKEKLKNMNMRYSVEIWDAHECTVKVNWIILNIDDEIKLFFSEKNKKLFKIMSLSKEISLFNGIRPTMPIEEAQRLDETLEYDDWEEIWQSSNGYWLEDSLENNEVVSVTIYIKELFDDAFDDYNW